MKRTTIKDLAQTLNVNISTVSRALKGHPDISKETRDKVQSLAKDLNYIPNFLAVHLRKKESKVIGLIIPSINMFFFPSVIQGIEDVVHKQGYNLLVLQSNEMLQREIENINICLQNGVDGLLLSVTSDSMDPSYLDSFLEQGIPIVMFDKVLDNTQIPKIIIDDFEAAQKATKHLIEKGKSNCIGIFGNPNLNITKRRIGGFLEALKNHGITPRQDAIQFGLSTDETFRKVSTIFSHNPPNGIFGMSDEILAGIIPAMKSKSIDIPRECSVVCISDGYLPSYLDPPITYIHHSGYEVGTKAAEILCQTLKCKESQILNTIPTKLIVQASS
jgi:LacI family transcriptional regulator